MELLVTFFIGLFGMFSLILCNSEKIDSLDLLAAIAFFGGFGRFIYLLNV